MAQTVEAFGKIDLFFNNAGISGSVYALRLYYRRFNSIVDVNLKGAFYGLKYVITEMLKTELEQC